MKPAELIKEVEKGCGKCNYLLCPTCQAKLEGMKQMRDAIIEEIKEFADENQVTYDMGNNWCVMLEDDEKSNSLLPFLKELKQEIEE